MSDFDFSNNDKFYFQYFNKGNSSYMDKVRYFEDHKSDITLLAEERRQEVVIDYMICLFEIGRYETYLKEIDPIIEMVVIENIYEFNGENIFNLLLRKKAACYINLKRPKDALPLISQLMRLDPENVNLPYFFYICNRKISQGSEEIIKGIAIISLMCGLSLKFAETFVVDPFFGEYLRTFSIITTTFFVSGASLLVINELYRRWYIQSEIKRIKRK